MSVMTGDNDKPHTCPRCKQRVNNLTDDEFCILCTLKEWQQVADNAENTACELPSEPTACPLPCVYKHGGCDSPRINKVNSDSACNSISNRALLEILKGAD